MEGARSRAEGGVGRGCGETGAGGEGRLRGQEEEEACGGVSACRCMCLSVCHRTARSLRQSGAWLERSEVTAAAQLPYSHYA
jgi:hypothetical protein